MTTSYPLPATTRSALHRVAEHVLAAAQFAEAGTIRLRVAPGGFETVHVLSTGRIGVRDGRLVVSDDATTRSADLTTLRSAAEFVGIAPGLPEGTYRAATSPDPEAPLAVDPASARQIADWFAVVDAALRDFAASVGQPTEPVLWPEHFDVGVAIDAVNYGGSPGDDSIARPYAYVGPYAGPPRRDAFWNADFGAACTVDEVDSVDGVVAFFHRGRELAGDTPAS